MVIDKIYFGEEVKEDLRLLKDSERIRFSREGKEFTIINETRLLRMKKEIKELKKLVKIANSIGI